MQTAKTLDAVSKDAGQAADLAAHWGEIRAVWKATQFGAFATVGPDGAPQVAPIGSVYLHPSEPRGYYHPVLTARFRKALVEDQRFELLFVDTRASRWLMGLLRGRFDRLVAARLKGHALGPRRPTTQQEAERWQRMVRAVRWTRGYDLLWKDVRFVQELAFDAMIPVRFGAMRHGSSGLTATT
jgi:hypothetical protein